MKQEIENLTTISKFNQIKSNSRKKKYVKKKQAIEQYEKEKSNYKLALKKHETLIKATTERGNKLQNELDQIKTKMTV